MDLEVVGRHALFFDDDPMAAFVNSSDALVEWNSLQIDRYDVRHLLSGSLPPRQPQKSRYSSHLADSSLESELDHERYLDLHESSDNQEMEDAGNPEDSGGYHSVSFSYGNSSDSANQKIAADGALGYHGFQPPFAVPESLTQSLPSTEKEHQIIARTALFVRQHGGQSEIVLRVKQGANPTFGFLMPDHHLHLYFRFLVDHPELLESNVKEKTQVNEKKVETASDSAIGGALTLLGSVYGDDEDGVEDSKSVAYEKTDNATSPRDSHVSQKMISISNDAEKEKAEAMSKLPASSHKEKTSFLKRNPSLTTSKAGLTSSVKKTDDPGSYLTSVKKSREPLIVEPPSDLKKLIDRIVEFIAKNGKQFEAALCEQDSEHLRFPFLLPSDQYHPYYLHVLQKAQESKGGTKNTLENNGSGAGRGLSSGFVASDVASYEFDRKEKFKMVIGKSKKDVQDLPSKATQQESGVTLDVATAAAILKAATRGIKNPDLGILSVPDNKIQKNNQAGGTNNSDPVGGASVANASDSTEAHLTKEQKLKAERLRRAKMFVAMLKSGNELSRCSSVEPVQSAVGSIEMNANSENAREGSSVPIDGSVLDGSGTFDRKYSVDEHMDRRSKRKYRSRSDRNEDDNEEDETELSHGRVSCEVDSDHKHRKEKSQKRRRKKHHRSHRRSHRDDSTGSSDAEAGHHKYSKKKKHHSSNRSSRKEEEEDDDDDFEHDKYDEHHHKHSKKKHRSHRSSDRKREKSDDPSSRDKEPEPCFGDAGKHDNTRHVEERKGSDSVKEELEEGEISSKVVVAEHDDTRGSVICNESLKEKSNATQRSQSTDVPDDLRAKIRAMLLATR